jgi:UDP-N-acetylglucosamine transferase subunit ALG13
VSVGTSHIPFDSLIRYIDNCANDSIYHIIAQIGSSTFEPLNIEWFRFRDYLEIQKLIRSSEFVIAHGGLGIISECLRENTPIVVVPRVGSEMLHSQYELVSYLSEKGYLDYVNKPEELYPYLTGEKLPKTRKFDFQTKIPEIINNYIREVIEIGN